MSRWGKADYAQFEQLQKNIKEISQKFNIDAFCGACCKELAARLLALVIPATPVGKYPKGVGKKGGTLRRNWGPRTAKDAKTYAQGLNVKKRGTDYSVEIINPIEYASYVEFGHITVNGGWVEGRHMLTVSEETLKTVAPKVLEKKLRDYLKEVFNV